MKLIKNPWNELFYTLVESSKNSIKITSPFVKYDVISPLLKFKNNKTSFSIITSFKLMSFYTKVSDLSALGLILNKKGRVKNFQRLHSKIYIFDDKVAVVSSSNLTNGGLIANFEYGVLIDDLKYVHSVLGDFENLYEDDFSGNITLEEIKLAQEIISKAPKSKKIILPDIETKKELEITDIYTGGIDSIKSSLSGWKLEVFNCLLEIPQEYFKLRDLNKFVPRLSKAFPRNYNIEAKIKQQLQNLRDTGLIQFLGRGQYQKLWRYYKYLKLN